ncbi:DUF1294 domain-containing protein [Acidovorax sp. HMWF029]|uniref:DUF1294 domain-containing protein n=1 Tax=Acidovorax sp. HMWF029 TaxID=2056863 RepID=UPI000D357772|nr:cold shock and DUF1294 domain-containing protein [Acidovorax sp. HMWF029]PTT22023.1 DUF1294 domain-containing protein [Acidovorax sp. HMWF029]
MQKQGTVIRWDATRAFGFIRSPDTSADVFFHVRDYRGSAAPREGLAVVYDEIHVGGKGPRAMAVQPAAQAGGAARPATSASTTAPQRKAQPARPPAPRPARRRERPAKAHLGAHTPAMPTLLLMLGWAALLGWGVWADKLPLWSLGAAAAINVLTFVIYAIDKSAAQNGQWRTKESHLHLLSLAGGWPGAWCAQQWLRHKSRKPEFRAVYWVTVAVHCAVLVAWLGGWLR